MQDDLEDGVAMDSGAGNRRSFARVFLTAAATAATRRCGALIKDAKLIKCAVSLAGVTSIDYLFDNAQTDLSRLAAVFDAARVPGRRSEDRSRALQARESARQCRQGRACLILLAYGASDRRVPLVHGTDFRAALDKYHKPYEWVVYTDEGHGLSRDVDLFDFFRRVERFLARSTSERKDDTGSPSLTGLAQDAARDQMLWRVVIGLIALAAVARARLRPPMRSRRA